MTAVRRPVSRRATEPEMQRHVATALEMLQHALGASQRIMMNLRPPILDQGLVAAVQWLAAGFERRTGLRVTVRRSADAITGASEGNYQGFASARQPNIATGL